MACAGEICKRFYIVPNFVLLRVRFRGMVSRTAGAWLRKLNMVQGEKREQAVVNYISFACFAGRDCRLCRSGVHCSSTDDGPTAHLNATNASACRGWL